ncbi:unnamed protein product [Gordionus sp. m RMFG-2023]
MVELVSSVDEEGVFKLVPLADEGDMVEIVPSVEEGVIKFIPPIEDVRDVVELVTLAVVESDVVKPVSLFVIKDKLVESVSFVGERDVDVSVSFVGNEGVAVEAVPLCVDPVLLVVDKDEVEPLFPLPSFESVDLVFTSLEVAGEDSESEEIEIVELLLVFTFDVVETVDIVESFYIII